MHGQFRIVNVYFQRPTTTLAHFGGNNQMKLSVTQLGGVVVSKELKIKNSLKCSSPLINSSVFCIT